MSNKIKKITVIKDGPYSVSAGIPLKKSTIIPDSDGCSNEWKIDDLEKKECEYHLCRCGKSKNRPFCDGSHDRCGFDGTEAAKDEAYLKEPDVIVGPELELHDVEALCASARFCDCGKGTWRFTEESDNQDSREKAIKQACNCPSGRLVIKDKKSGKIIEPDFEQEIDVVDDPEAGVGGPLYVKGGIPIESADGEDYQIRNRVTLCRCGKSKNKPFCDGSHVAEKFSRD